VHYPLRSLIISDEEINEKPLKQLKQNEPTLSPSSSVQTTLKNQQQNHSWTINSNNHHRCGAPRETLANQEDRERLSEIEYENKDELERILQEAEQEVMQQLSAQGPGFDADTIALYLAKQQNQRIEQPTGSSVESRQPWLLPFLLLHHMTATHSVFHRGKIFEEILMLLFNFLRIC